MKLSTMIFQFLGHAKDSECTVFGSAIPQGSRRCAGSSTLGANGSAAASRLIKTQPYLSSPLQPQQTTSRNWHRIPCFDPSAGSLATGHPVDKPYYDTGRQSISIDMPSTGHNRATSMQTDIGKGLNTPLFISGNDYLITQQIISNIIAWVRDLIYPGNCQLFLPEY